MKLFSGQFLKLVIKGLLAFSLFLSGSTANRVNRDFYSWLAGQLLDKNATSSISFISNSYELNMQKPQNINAVFFWDTSNVQYFNDRIVNFGLQK